MPEYPFITEAMPPVMKWFLQWLATQPVLTALLIAIVIDVATGVIRAVSLKHLNSTTSWIGMSRKVLTLMVVGFSVALQPFAGGLPLSQMVSAFYLFTEGLSILENVAAVGLPLPQVLINTLQKLKDTEGKGAGVSQMTVNLPKNIHADISTDDRPQDR